MIFCLLCNLFARHHHIHRQLRVRFSFGQIRCRQMTSSIARWSATRSANVRVFVCPESPNADCEALRSVESLPGETNAEVKPAMAHDKRTAYAALRITYPLILCFSSMCFFLSASFYEVLGIKFPKNQDFEPLSLGILSRDERGACLFVRCLFRARRSRGISCKGSGSAGLSPRFPKTSRIPVYPGHWLRELWLRFLQLAQPEAPPRLACPAARAGTRSYNTR